MRLTPILSVCALLSLAACAPGFVAEVKGETTVPAGPPGVSSLLEAFPAVAGFSGMDFNQNQDFKNQGISKDQVSSAKLKSIQLKIVSPADQDFSFLDTLEFSVKAGDREVPVARKASIPPGLKTLEMDLLDVELQPFLTAPTMTLSVRGKGRMPSREVRLEANVKLDVQVRLGPSGS